jgi:ADP-ribose pyrophosphatase YjhB (NUDIX family)
MQNNGRTIAHNEKKMPVVGVGAVVWKGDAVLLIRRGHPPRQGSWSLPGGHQEWGETVHQAVEREVREEAGVGIRIFDLAEVVDLIGRDGQDIRFHYTVIDLVAEWVDGEAVAGDDAEAVAWVGPTQLDDYVLTEAVRRVIRRAAEKRRQARSLPTPPA